MGAGSTDANPGAVGGEPSDDRGGDNQGQEGEGGVRRGEAGNWVSASLRWCWTECDGYRVLASQACTHIADVETSFRDHTYIP
jgi:hypothetical protein